MKQEQMAEFVSACRHKKKSIFIGQYKNGKFFRIRINNSIVEDYITSHQLIRWLVNALEDGT